jgi:anti-sigma-K factor RskA
MNYRNPQLLDELAAGYALGTLRGSARRRFERLCVQWPAALHALHRWEERLLGLAAEITPVKPPAIIWQRVRERLGHGGPEKRSSFFGRWNRIQLAFAATVATVALGIGIWLQVLPSTTSVVATFADQQQTELWRVEAAAAREQLMITRSAASVLETSRDYELWALPDSGAAPVSLGLMPKSGKRALTLSTSQRLALAGASKIAISLEPIGGSPTGAPTGPVLFVASMASVG